MDPSSSIKIGKYLFLVCFLILIVNSFIWLKFFIFLLNYTKYGRYFTAIGSNPSSSSLSGINNNKFKILGFVITSLLVGVAGIILASLMDTGQQGSAKGFELIVIAAVWAWSQYAN